MKSFQRIYFIGRYLLLCIPLLWWSHLAFINPTQSPQQCAPLDSLISSSLNKSESNTVSRQESRWVEFPIDKETTNKNLLVNGDFEKGIFGEIPANWSLHVPNSNVSSEFSWVVAPHGKPCLMARGLGQVEEYGFVHQTIQLNAHHWYVLRVVFRVEDIEDVHHHLVHAVVGKQANEVITMYTLHETGWIVGECNFKASEFPIQVRLYFRYSPFGKVWWGSVSVEPSVGIPRRLVKIAVGSKTHNWGKWLDVAGENKVDVALLPEYCNKKTPTEPEDIETGPTFRLLSKKAKQWKMYISTSIYEERGSFIFNTAPLYNRNGTLVSTYEKTLLYDMEAEEGVTPGSGYKVFKADFGTIGFATCYDSWFPETFRLLAYKGAELVLFPSQAYYQGIMSARAADNGLWIAAASQLDEPDVWDSSGISCAELAIPKNKRNKTRRAPTSIVSCERKKEYHMLIVTIDLSKRYAPHYNGSLGLFRSAPGGRRPRQTLINRIEEEIVLEAKRWHY